MEAIVHGAVKRVRPKAMTVAAAFTGLLPILWSTGTGADLMKRIAAPMVGGLVTSFILELLVYPAVYFLWKGRGLADGPATAPVTGRASSSQAEGAVKELAKLLPEHCACARSTAAPRRCRCPSCGPETSC